MRQVPQTRMNIRDFKRKKENNQKITMITCYDYPSARILNESEIDCILVGDTVAMVVHGHSSTIMADIPMMLLHTSAVARGLGKQFLISDLPFLSYRTSFADTMSNVKQLLQAGAHAVKMEGADCEILNTIKQLVTAGVPVMGHIGLTPQSIHQLGGYIVQGKQQAKALELIEQSRALEAAGCFAIVLECVPSELAKEISETLAIPTIGIGAGKHTNGQVLVWHDMLGLQTELKPRFVKQFCSAKEILTGAINDYVADVCEERFPSLEQSFV